VSASIIISPETAIACHLGRFHIILSAICEFLEKFAYNDVPLETVEVTPRAGLQNGPGSLGVGDKALTRT
jgi:hypothetical protein